MRNTWKLLSFGQFLAAVDIVRRLAIRHCREVCGLKFSYFWLATAISNPGSPQIRSRARKLGSSEAGMLEYD